MNNTVIIGAPHERRIALLQAALASLKWPPATVVPYTDLLAGTQKLERCITPNSIVRIESAGKCADTNQQFLAAGATRVEAQYAQTTDVDLTNRGVLYSTRQWYLGYCDVLDQIAAQLDTAPPHRLMTSVGAIKQMFDKRQTQAVLAKAGIPIPKRLPVITSYAELRAQMAQHKVSRVFIKPAHGSSASGIVALMTTGTRSKAITTIRPAADGKFYNSRQIQTINNEKAIATLVNYVLGHRAHVEQWLPKASFRQQSCDVRIVVINGKAQHSIVRLSDTPFTNLHLLNNRADIEDLITHIGEETWQAAATTAERAAACFPDAFYVGVDLMFTPQFKRHFVLELNAFGDLLPTVKYNGMDTYTAELSAFTQ